MLVSGATGHFGSAAVVGVLAPSAHCVVAPGRNQSVLADLQRRFGRRLRPVELSSNEQDDRDRLIDAACAPIDCVLDILPAVLHAR